MRTDPTKVLTAARTDIVGCVARLCPQRQKAIVADQVEATPGNRLRVPEQRKKGTRSLTAPEEPAETKGKKRVDAVSVRVPPWSKLTPPLRGRGETQGRYRLKTSSERTGPGKHRPITLQPQNRPLQLPRPNIPGKVLEEE